MFAKLNAAVLTVALSASAVFGQGVQVFGGPDPDRKSSSVFMLDETFTPKAGAAIDYSAPEWKDEYNDMLDTLKGKDARLGKNWWTSLSTMSACEIGGAKIEAGSYFLGLRCDKDGNFHLLVLPAAENLKAKAAPWMPDTWKSGIACKLTFAKDSLKESVAKMQIEITADAKQPSSGKLAIRWGKHELSAPVVLHLAGAK